MAESTDQDVEGGRLVTELGGDLRRRPSLDEEGAEGFIAAMEGRSGLEEEAPAGLVVHGVGSHQLTVFRRPGTPSVPVPPKGARGRPGRPPRDFRGGEPAPRAEGVLTRPILGMRMLGLGGRKIIKNSGPGRRLFPGIPASSRQER